MDNLELKTERLLIARFDESMIERVHLHSLDDDNRRFVPDEVFETLEETRDTVRFLIQRYDGNDGPFVYPVLLLPGKENIGYVQAVPLGNGDWEVGYHIAEKYTRNGYAGEAVTAFVPVIMKLLGILNIWGICKADNAASRRVLEKSGFQLQEKTVTDYKGGQHEVCRYLYCAVRKSCGKNEKRN